MPNTLKHIFIIRAPKWFSMAWNTIKYVMEADTRKKVEIVSGGEQSLALLRKHMSDDSIPAYLGGKMHTQGDSECKLILGSSYNRPMPQEALSAFFSALERGDGGNEATGQAGTQRLAGTDERSFFSCFRSCSTARERQ